ncbi:MAG TPA: hypothetical protein DCM05_08575 [Elusimicrobia bacterium]|nr:hypothetical protein [Elusimicrobiota bacterium]
MFDDLMSDRVTIRTGDGKEYKDIPASVQKNRIYTDATEIPIRPGDEVIRRTPAGVDEVFIVEDPGLCSGVGGISDSYQMHVRRVDKAQHSLGSTPASATTAERDALTKLWARGKMDSELPKFLEEANKSSGPLSVIMVDIDHFKSVNDQHGHQAGDAVLVGVAARLVATITGKGQVYRYGGEEILIILPNHTVEEATVVAERARRELVSSTINGLTITASFGVGTYPKHGSNVSELIKAADVAMYDAKNRGRDLVRVSGEPEPQADKSRTPERKLPPAGVLTEEEQQTIRQRHFAGFDVRCPKDGALLRIEEIGSIGSATVDLVIQCRMCGLTDQF